MCTINFFKSSNLTSARFVIFSLFRPVLFSLHKDDLYSADFLLATLTPAVEPSQSTSRTNGTSQRANTSNHPSPVPTLRNKTSMKFYTSYSVIFFKFIF